ncbi:MAG: gspD, partial [Pseudomonas sp.]|nr:gspD [Pseudomonas sp.]
MNDRYPELSRLRSPLLCLATAVALAGCASTPEPFKNDPALMQEALNGTGSQRTAMVDPPAATASPTTPAATTAARRQITQGNQTFVRGPAPAANTPKGAAQTSGDIVFNFTDQPIEAVINSVMGDLLHENYSIAQGVKGNVSFSTSQPVNKQQA